MKPTTQNLSDVRIIRTRANVIDRNGRKESRKYALPPGNFTPFGFLDDYYRVEFGFGNAHVICYLRDGPQRSYPVEALRPVLQPNKTGGYEPSPIVRDYY